MIVLKLGTPEWQVVWTAISGYVEDGRVERVDGKEDDDPLLKTAERIMGEMDAEMASLSAVARESVKRERTKVILTVRAGRDRMGTRHWRAELTARGTWTEMYKSKPRATEDEARALAMKYLAKNADWMVLDPKDPT